ncbi:MAG: hypothetical protein ACI9D0_000336 [Bacteroidia bacterium]|jgi:hypothetical protein
MKMKNILIGVSCALGLQLAATASSGTPDLFALRVGSAETVSHGTIPHAVILIEHGKIVTIGQDLEIERGIPVIDRPDWVAMPGFVNCYSRAGMTSFGSNGTVPSVQSSTELYPNQAIYGDLLEVGVTTLGLYPPGNGIPGQAVAIRTSGSTAKEMILQDSVYMKMLMRSNASSKKMIRGAFEEADDHKADVEKAREKWEKDTEKWEKDQKKKKDAAKKDKEKDGAARGAEDEEDKGPGDFVEPTPNGTASAFIDLRNGDLSALISIRKAGDYLHLMDALGEEDFDWVLRVPLRDDIDLFEVTDKLAEDERTVVIEPRLTLMAWTMRERNLPAELSTAGVDVVFVPNGDTLKNHKDWRFHVGHIVKRGMDYQAALRAMTLGPAEVLGLGDRLGSLDVGKDANILFFSGDPLQPASLLEMVMIDGEFVSDEVVR